MWAFCGRTSLFQALGRLTFYTLLASQAVEIDSSPTPREDATALALSMTIGQVHEIIPMEIPFTVLGASKGFEEIAPRLEGARDISCVFLNQNRGGWRSPLLQRIHRAKAKEVQNLPPLPQSSYLQSMERKKKQKINPSSSLLHSETHHNKQGKHKEFTSQKGNKKRDNASHSSVAVNLVVDQLIHSLNNSNTRVPNSLRKMINKHQKTSSSESKATPASHHSRLNVPKKNQEQQEKKSLSSLNTHYMALDEDRPSSNQYHFLQSTQAKAIELDEPSFSSLTHAHAALPLNSTYPSEVMQTPTKSDDITSQTNTNTMLSLPSTLGGPIVIQVRNSPEPGQSNSNAVAPSFSTAHIGQLFSV